MRFEADEANEANEADEAGHLLWIAIERARLVTQIAHSHGWSLVIGQYDPAPAAVAPRGPLLSSPLGS